MGRESRPRPPTELMPCSTSSEGCSSERAPQRSEERSSHGQGAALSGAAAEGGGPMRASLTRTIIKLVVFFALCSVFTAYLAFTIGNIHLFRHTYTLKATFDDATGLLADDNVKVAGVVVGKVTKVSIHQGRARVRFTVRSSTKLPTDSTAAIRWR